MSGRLARGRETFTIGRTPRWFGRLALASIVSGLIGVVTIMTNLPMTTRFHFAVASIGDVPPAQLTWPHATSPELSDCGRVGTTSGVEYTIPDGPDATRGLGYVSEPSLYYCPSGLDTDRGTNHSDFESLGGPWWMDWQDD